MAHAITLQRNARHALCASITPAGACQAHLLLTSLAANDPRHEEHVRVSAVLDVAALRALRSLIDDVLAADALPLEPGDDHAMPHR